MSNKKSEKWTLSVISKRSACLRQIFDNLNKFTLFLSGSHTFKFCPVLYQPFWNHINCLLINTIVSIFVCLFFIKLLVRATVAGQWSKLNFSRSTLEKPPRFWAASKLSCSALLSENPRNIKKIKWRYVS